MRQFTAEEFTEAAEEVLKAVHPVAYREADWRGYAEDAWVQNGESAPESSAYEFDLLSQWLENHEVDVETTIKMLEAQKAIREAGPVSKAAQWVDKIESGEATLEDARDDVSKPTYYKIRDAVDGGLAWEE